VLPRKVLDAAARRYAELTDYLAARRLAMPGDEPVTPDAGDVQWLPWS
jgi:hypothetical protein